MRTNMIEFGDAMHRIGVTLSLVFSFVETHATLITLGLAVLGYGTRTYFERQEHKLTMAIKEAELKKLKGGM